MEAATCGPGPNSFRSPPAGTRGRPCVDAGREARKRATSGPGGCPRTRSSQHWLRVALVSIATDSRAAGPQRRPRVRGHLCDNEASRATAARTGRFRRIAMRSPQRSQARSAWWRVRGLGRASHPEEDGAWPACPLSSDSIRQPPKPTSARTPRGARLLKADPSRGVAGSWLAENCGTRLWAAGALPLLVHSARPCR